LEASQRSVALFQSKHGTRSVKAVGAMANMAVAYGKLRMPLEELETQMKVLSIREQAIGRTMYTYMGLW
jgi:hypothetical protein